MQLAMRIEIKPANAQEKILSEISEKCRLVYNYALAELLKALNEGRQLTYIDQQNSLPKIKKAHTTYKIAHSKTLKYALKELDSSFRSFMKRAKKDKNASLPKYKGEYRFTTFAYDLLNEEGCRRFAEMRSNSQKGLPRARIPSTLSAERTRTR
ncbi:MAG: helix-turn-helix domain-containing protein [Candidatus Micrarchaeia archaeon]